MKVSLACEYKIPPLKSHHDYSDVNTLFPHGEQPPPSKATPPGVTPQAPRTPTTHSLNTSTTSPGREVTPLRGGGQSFPGVVFLCRSLTTLSCNKDGCDGSQKKCCDDTENDSYWGVGVPRIGLCCVDSDLVGLCCVDSDLVGSGGLLNQFHEVKSQNPLHGVSVCRLRFPDDAMGTSAEV